MISQNAWFAREGRGLIAVCLITMFLLHGLFGTVVLPLWLPVLLLMWILRDPRRQIPSAPLAVISPVDGTVVAVDESVAPYIDKPGYRISIRMPWTGVFTFRSVVEGKIIQHWLGKAGEGLPYSHGIWIQTDEQDDIIVAIRRGRWFGRIGCYVSTGERVGQGQRCGFIPLGTATVDVYVPTRSTLETGEGDKLKAGESVLAKLVHS